MGSNAGAAHRWLAAAALPRLQEAARILYPHLTGQKLSDEEVRILDERTRKDATGKRP